MLPGRRRGWRLLTWCVAKVAADITHDESSHLFVDIEIDPQARVGRPFAEDEVRPEQDLRVGYHGR